MASTLNALTTGGGGIVATGDSSGVMQLQTNNGTTAVTIDTSQNVGIGTTSPLYKIDAQSSADTILNSQSTGTIQSAMVRIVGRNSSVDKEWNIVATGSGLGSDALRFVRGGWTGTPSMLIDSSGNVGIGTTSPLSRLQVKAEGQNFGDGYILEKSSGTIMYNQVVGSDNALYLGYSSDSGSSFSSRMVIDSSGNLLFNSGYGSVATAYGCRAWVNFNGTGTVAIRGSGGVTSITDNGTGLYTVNYNFTLVDANYCANVSMSQPASGTGSYAGGFADATGSYSTTALSLRFQLNSGGDNDPIYVCVSVIR